MTIQLLQALRIAGVETASGTRLTLDPSVESDFVTRGVASYFGNAPSAAEPVVRSPACGTVAILSDSRGQMCHTFTYGGSIASMTRSAGVVTVNITSHGFPTGHRVRVINATPASFNGEYVVTRVDANNFTFACPGADGSATVSAASVIDRSAMSGKGFWFHAQTLLAGRARLLRNASVGGNTTADLLSRWKTEIMTMPTRPQWVVVFGFYNDIGATGFTSSTTIANLRAIFEQARDVGIRVCAVTEPALHASGSKFSAANVEWVLAVNRFIRAYVRENPGCVLADAFRLTVDAANTTNRGASLSGMIDTDNVHVIGRGQYYVGKAVANAVSPYMPDASPFVTCAAETSVAGVNKHNALDACIWVSTGGTISSPAAAIGSPPAGGAAAASTGITIERVSGTGTSCEVYTELRSDGGFNQCMDITPNSGGIETWQMRSNTGSTILANLTAGEFRRFVCEVTVSGVPSSTFWSVVANVTLTIDGVSYTFATGAGIPAVNAINENYAGTIVSEPIRIPGGTITNAGWNLQASFTTTGSKVTVKCGRPSFELTTDNYA